MWSLMFFIFDSKHISAQWFHATVWFHVVAWNHTTVWFHAAVWFHAVVWFHAAHSQLNPQTSIQNYWQELPTT